MRKLITSVLIVLFMVLVSVQIASAQTETTNNEAAKVNAESSTDTGTPKAIAAAPGMESLLKKGVLK